MSNPSLKSAAESSQGNQSIYTLLHDANERKSDGNDFFRQSKWNEALVAYQAALNLLPKRRSPTRKPTESLDDDLDQRESTPEAKLNPAKGEEDQEPFQNQVDSENSSDSEIKEVVQLRSVLFANMGACHVKLSEHKQAVEACTQALEDNPTYEKVLQRRAASNEALDSWSSLGAAQEDYNALLPIVQSNSQKREIEIKLQKLRPRLEAAQKKETSEMLDKLKGLGDSLLGNFGLSTDNFKFEPNGQGGYSMNFVK